MRNIILGAVFWIMTGSFCFAETIPFQEVKPSQCILGQGQSFDLVLTTQEQFNDFLYQHYHQYFMDTLISWGQITKKDIPADYKDQLRKLREKEPGLREAVYLKKINEKLGQSLMTTEAMPMLTIRNCIFPVIDFSRETLIIMNMSLVGCRKPLIENSIKRDADQKTCLVELHITQYGSCQVAHFASVWLKIPKPPADYQIKFKKEISTSAQ